MGLLPEMVFLFLLLLITSIPVTYERNCTCGIERQVTRVINGKKTIAGHFPWVVRVTKDTPRSKTYCTGSLISRSFVLTAAHCVSRNRNASAVKVFLSQDCGYRETEKDTSERERLHEKEVMRITRNKRYNDRWPNGNDIALLELRIPITIDDPDFMPVCLTDSQIFDHLIVSGWGNIANGSRIMHSDCLNEAEIDFVSNRDCWYTHPHANFNFIMCAGGRKSNICFGDSGGPLMMRKFGRVFKVGITSFMRNGCLSGRPAAFERIATHLPWIIGSSKGTVCLP